MIIVLLDNFQLLCLSERYAPVSPESSVAREPYAGVVKLAVFGTQVVVDEVTPLISTQLQGEVALFE